MLLAWTLASALVCRAGLAGDARSRVAGMSPRAWLSVPVPSVVRASGLCVQVSTHGFRVPHDGSVCVHVRRWSTQAPESPLVAHGSVHQRWRTCWAHDAPFALYPEPGRYVIGLSLVPTSAQPLLETSVSEDAATEASGQVSFVFWNASVAAVTVVAPDAPLPEPRSAGCFGGRADRGPPPRLFDAFTLGFMHQLDMLEVRLDELATYPGLVHKHVIVEASLTFTGLPRTPVLTRPAVRARFARHMSRIVHSVVDFPPPDDVMWTIAENAAQNQAGECAGTTGRLLAASDATACGPVPLCSCARPAASERISVRRRAAAAAPTALRVGTGLLPTQCGGRGASAGRGKANRSRVRGRP